MARLTNKETEIYRKYHSRGCGNHTTVKVDAILINRHNKKEHEVKKAALAYELMQNGSKIITEAERNKRRNEKARVIDLVDLTTGIEHEIVFEHESHEEVKRHRQEGIKVHIINGFVCEKCGLEYPIRNKKTMCRCCENENNTFPK